MIKSDIYNSRYYSFDAVGQRVELKSYKKEKKENFKKINFKDDEFSAALIATFI
jgi:hypothetical protein